MNITQVDKARTRCLLFIDCTDRIEGGRKDEIKTYKHTHTQHDKIRLKTDTEQGNKHISTLSPTLCAISPTRAVCVCVCFHVSANVLVTALSLL